MSSWPSRFWTKFPRYVNVFDRVFRILVIVLDLNLFPVSRLGLKKWTPIRSEGGGVTLKGEARAQGVLRFRWLSAGSHNLVDLFSTDRSGFNLIHCSLFMKGDY